MIYNFIDENKIIKDLLKDKTTINKNPMQKLIVYIKYLKSEGKNKPTIRIMIEELMEEYYIGFCVADWDDILNKLINKYTKAECRELKTVGSVNITRKELEYIKHFKNDNIEKLLFTMLVIGKYSKHNEDDGVWINCDSEEMFKIAKFKYGKSTRVGSRFEQREYLIYDLANMENPPIQVSNKCNSTSIKVLFNDNEVDKEGITLTINQDNVQQLPYYYIEWKTPEKIIRCQECGCLVEVKNTNKVKPERCDKCKKKKHNEVSKKSMKKSNNS